MCGAVYVLQEALLSVSPRRSVADELVDQVCGQRGRQEKKIKTYQYNLAT